MKKVLFQVIQDLLVLDFDINAYSVATTNVYLIVTGLYGHDGILPASYILHDCKFTLRCLMSA